MPDRSGAGTRLCLAFAADAFFGEPPLRCHPVYWMGKLVDLADWGMPGRESGPAAERIAGAVVAVALPVGTYLAVARLLAAAPRRMRTTIEVALLSFALAGRSLYESAGDVQRGLAKNEAEGRAHVSRMVGRDTQLLDEAGVTRAAIESVAENCNDGIIAPMFYGLIGGAPLAMAYKMINTLDSMIGYRNLRYGDFGWASAKLDDAAGFIPARLTAVAASLAGPLAGGSTGGALAVWRRDAAAHASPNAGVCEAAFAGALGVCLGGRNHYDDIPVETPLMGSGLRQPAWEDIGRAANLMYVASTMALVLLTVARRLARGRGAGRLARGPSEDPLARGRGAA